MHKSLSFFNPNHVFFGDYLIPKRLMANNITNFLITNKYVPIRYILN